MPKTSLLNLPYSGVPTVESTAPPVVWQDIKTTDEMFGAAKGRALQGLGKAIEGFGDTISAIDEKNKGEQAHTEATKIDTQMTKDLTILRSKYDTDPNANFEDYDKEAKEIANNAIKSSASNPRAQKLVNPAANRQYLNAWEYGFKQNVKKVEAQADQADTARGAQAMESAASAGDEKGLQDAVETLNGVEFSKGQRRKIGPEAIAANQKTARSAAYGRFIGNMADNNPGMAQEYANAYDKDTLDVDRDIIRKHIDAGFAKQSGNVAGDSANNGGQQVAPVRRPVKGPGAITEKPKGPGGTEKLPGIEEKPKEEKKSELDTTPTDISAQARIPTVGPTGSPARPIPGYPVGVTTAVVEHTVVAEAKRRGIDPGTALQVYFSEGSTDWKSGIRGEDSWGPFQLHTGGGEGDNFQRDLNKDPRDPNTWRENIQYALNKVVANGWGAWHGAKVYGITGKMGVAPNAREVPVGTKAERHDDPNPDDDAEVASDDIEHSNVPMAKRSFMQYAKDSHEGEPKAAEGKSRVIEAQAGHIRGLPPSPQLKAAFETAAAAAHVQIRITSGGQTHERDPSMKDRPGGWTGSLRHNHGNASDVDILDDNGKVIQDRNDPRRLAFLEAVAKEGAGGIGTGYMGDPLKVHIGITGASGKVGEGLGVYSRQTTAAERAAVEKGLNEGGREIAVARGGEFQPGQSEGRAVSGSGGRVRYASLETGTVSDASPNIPRNTDYTTPPLQYAQVQTSDGTALSTGKQWGPVTAQTTVSEINARIKEYADMMQAAGQNPNNAKIFAQELRHQHEMRIQEQTDLQKKAEATVQDNVFGNESKGVKRADSIKDIYNNPDAKEAMNALTPERQEHYRSIFAARDKEKNRPPTSEELDAWDNLVANAPYHPEMLEGINLAEWPQALRSRIMKLRDQMMKTGSADNVISKRVDDAVKTTDVDFMLNRAGILSRGPGGKTVESEDYPGFRAALAGELEFWHDNPKNSGKEPTQEELNGMVGSIIRKKSIETPTTFTINGSPIFSIGGSRSEMAFQKPMSKAEEGQIVKDWNKAHPTDQVQKSEEIRPDKVWYWRRRMQQRLQERTEESTSRWQP